MVKFRGAIEKLPLLTAEPKMNKEQKSVYCRHPETSSTLADVSADPECSDGKFRLIKPEEYEKISEIGVGSSGTVFVVKVKATGVKYALKVHRSIIELEVMMQTYIREVTNMARCDHPNVISLLGVKAEKLGPSILMPLYSSSLFTFMVPFMVPFPDGHKKGILRYAYDIIAGIAHLHSRNIIHRDIKPRNILYDSKNDRMVICDLGSSISLFHEKKERSFLYDCVTL